MWFFHHTKPTMLYSLFVIYYFVIFSHIILNFDRSEDRIILILFNIFLSSTIFKVKSIVRVEIKSKTI